MPKNEFIIRKMAGRVEVNCFKSNSLNSIMRENSTLKNFVHEQLCLVVSFFSWYFVSHSSQLSSSAIHLTCSTQWSRLCLSLKSFLHVIEAGCWRMNLCNMNEGKIIIIWLILFIIMRERSNAVNIMHTHTVSLCLPLEMLIK